MKTLAVAGCWATVAVALIPGRGLVPAHPAPHRSDDGGAFRRAHAAAVRYRAERDDLQRRLVRRVREAAALRRALMRRPSSLEALRLAALVYRVPFPLLYAIASCESTGEPPAQPASEQTLSAHAANPSTAKGLAQALDSTWRSSIFHAFSPYSPYASALFIGSEVHAGHLWQWDASKACWR